MIGMGNTHIKFSWFVESHCYRSMESVNVSIKKKYRLFKIDITQLLVFNESKIEIPIFS